MRAIARALTPVLGPLDDAAAPLAYLFYWWLIPVAQFFLAM